MSFRRVEAIAAERQGRRPEETVLQRARSALGGAASSLSVEDAIEVLASSSFPNRHRDLERVLTDPQAPSRVRMRAATALARCDREVAREILVSAVAIDDPVVLTGVMRALGMVGDLGALEAIDRVMPALSGRARDHAEFARILIAHRLGQAVPSPSRASAEKPLEPAPDCGRRVHIRPAGPSAIERCLTSMGLWPYGIEVDEQAVFQFSCDRSSGAILLNRAFTGRDALDILRARPALLGLEARRDRASGDYSVSTVLLTTPIGDAIDIVVHLTNGTRVFTGRAELRGERAHWSLRAIRRVGAFPFRASGTFADGLLNIEIAESGTRVEEHLRPKPIDVGADRSSGTVRA